MVNYDTNITVNGSLVVNGQAGKMVNMTTNSTGYLWNGIFANAGSNLNFNYLYMNNATMLISWNDLFMNNSKLTDMPYGVRWTVMNNSAALTLMNSLFWSVGNSYNTYVDCNIVTSSEKSWNLAYTDPVTIKNNVFSDGSFGFVIKITYSLSSANSSTTTIHSDVIFEGNVASDFNSESLMIYRNLYAFQESTITFVGDILYKGNDLTDGFGGLELMNWAGESGLINGTVSITGDVKVLDNSFTNMDLAVWKYEGLQLKGRREGQHHQPAVCQRQRGRLLRGLILPGLHPRV